MSNRNDQAIQKNNAILVYEYLRDYIVLEKEVRNVVISNFDKIPTEMKQMLFFLHGAKSITTLQTQFTEGVVVANRLSYDAEKAFKSLSLANILALNKEKPLFDVLDIKINSLERKMDEFSFYYICNALLKMRNLIAHVISTEKEFDNVAIVSNLSVEGIKKNLPSKMSDISIEHLNEFSITILSNYIYMMEIIKRITVINNPKEISQNSSEKTDA